jgi:hypothetical protein
MGIWCGRQSNERCAERGDRCSPSLAARGMDSLLVEIDRQFFDEMINRFNNNNIKMDRI